MPKPEFNFRDKVNPSLDSSSSLAGAAGMLSSIASAFNASQNLSNAFSVSDSASGYDPANEMSSSSEKWASVGEASMALAGIVLSILAL